MAPAGGLRLPQMGWNELVFAPGAHPLLDGLLPGDHAYFVHSYALAGGDPAEMHRHHRLRRRRGRHGGARQPRRHPVPRREKPGGRPPHPRQLPALDTHEHGRRRGRRRSPASSVERVSRLHRRRPRRAVRGRRSPPSSTAAASAGSTRPGGRRWSAISAACCWCPSASCSSARLDGVIVGSAQLVRPPRNNEAQAFAATLMHAFIAPYARGHGLARAADRAGGGGRPRARLPGAEPRRARDPGRRRSRSTSRSATSAGASIPAYARVGGRTVRGIYYYKLLQPGGPGGV